MRNFDLAVIGSGPGGYRAAVLGAIRGLKVAIVERDVWGGTCLNRGCVPKKQWYHSARLLSAAPGLAARGVKGRIEPDFDAAWAAQRKVVETVRTSYVDYLQRLGIARFEGHATLRTANRVEVAGGEAFSARNVVLATGSSPFVPPALASAGARVLTTDDLFDRMPPTGRRVVLLGSGVIGTEMAFILAMLGFEIAWFTQSDPLERAGFSASARRVLREALAEVGIAPRKAGRPSEARADGNAVVLSFPDGSTACADWVLLGSGRRPNTRDLGLDAVGVALDDAGFVRVDAHARTNVQNIFAIGDCANPRMTSNHALAEATVAIANIVAPGSAARRPELVPDVVYSAVELARLGMSEDEAEMRGHEPATGFAGFEVSPAALSEGDSRGFVRLIADHDSGALLGAEAVGLEAGEWIHVVAACAERPDPLRALAAVRYNHPSFAEELLNATEVLAAKWGLGANIFPVAPTRGPAPAE